MKTVSPTPITTTTRIRSGKTPKVKTHFRLAAFLVLAMVAAGIGLVRISSAKFSSAENGEPKSEKRKGLEKTPLNRSKKSKEISLETEAPQNGDTARVFDLRPRELSLTKSSRQFNGDLRTLPKTAPKDMWREEHEPPEEPPIFYVPQGGLPNQPKTSKPALVPAAPAPTPLEIGRAHV